MNNQPELKQNINTENKKTKDRMIKKFNLQLMSKFNGHNKLKRNSIT